MTTPTLPPLPERRSIEYGCYGSNQMLAYGQACAEAARRAAIADVLKIMGDYDVKQFTHGGTTFDDVHATVDEIISQIKELK